MAVTIRACTRVASSSGSPVPNCPGKMGSSTLILTIRLFLNMIPPFLGMISPVPSISTGSSGLSVFRASWKAPALNLPIAPVSERVPSGKITTEMPSCNDSTHLSIILMTLDLLPLISSMYFTILISQPTSGIRNISLLETHLRR